jgi:hypothetical protein
MALTIEQMAAVSYPAVVAEMRRPANQWVENAALRVLEKNGFIQHTSLGANIEVPVDYRPNPDTAILAGDQDTAALVKTEIISTAAFDIAQLNVPVTWTKGDDAKNPSETQKIALVRSLLENAINSHDDLIEQSIFTTSAAGGVEVNGLDTLVPTTGQGVVGGIDSSIETWWRNPVDVYTDGSDIEAAMTSVFNVASKGSGSQLQPKVVLSGPTPFTLFMAQLQSQQRWGDGGKANAGFSSIQFMNADYIYSQYGGANIYFVNPKNYQLVVSKQYFRDKGSTYDVPGQNAFYFLIYSALQFIVNNKSRLAMLSLAP